MGTNREVTEATGFQELQDILRGIHTRNLATKDCVSGQNSLVDPALSTAGSYVVNGAFVSAAASSSAFALEDTLVPAGGACTFVLCLNAAGSGIGYAANVLTSVEVSSAVANADISAATVPLTMRDKSVYISPTIPTTMCPVGLYTVVAGSVSHIAGSSSFSDATSAGGSHLFTDIATYARD